MNAHTRPKITRMKASRLDRISKALAQPRLSRRRTLAQGAAGLVAGTLTAPGVIRGAAAQEATPASDPGSAAPAEGPTMLSVQTFQSGTITPIEGVAGHYTLTLEAGTGQTVYFSDRPGRIVGTNPTPQFLDGLGFPADNPPNAALVVETAPGETDVAVVELFDHRDGPVSQSVTYEGRGPRHLAGRAGDGAARGPGRPGCTRPQFRLGPAFHRRLPRCADVLRAQRVPREQPRRTGIEDRYEWPVLWGYSSLGTRWVLLKLGERGLLSLPVLVWRLR